MGEELKKSEIELFIIKEVDKDILKGETTAEFVYNYFEKTENEAITKKYSQSTEGIPLQMLPRYVKVDFSRAHSGNHRGLSSSQFISDLDKMKLEEIIVNAREENRISSSGYLGIEFIDRDTADGFYDLSTYIQRKTDLVNASLSTNSNILNTLYNATHSAIRGNEEAYISAMITDSDFNQPIQYEDELKEKAALHSGVFNKINSIKIKSFINKAYEKNVLNKLSKSKSSPYADEMTQLLEVLDFLDDVDLDATTRGYLMTQYIGPGYHFIDPLISKTYSTEVLGYIVEKYENVMTGDAEYSRNNKIVHPPFYVKGTNPTSIIDRNVKYGGSYEYIVKTVVGFENYAQIEQETIEYPAMSTSYMAKVLKVYISGGSAPISVLCNERIPPLPPENVTYKYNFKKDALVILWDFPFNKQQDIKRFQIYRRDSLENPFELLREIDFDNSTIRKDLTASSGNKNNVRRTNSPTCCFYDTDFNIESSYIYAIAAIDARGMTSGYSSQFIVSYNRFINKTNAKFISKEGAPKPYPNIFLEIDALPDVITSTRKNKINIYFNPECKETWMTKDSNTSREKVFLNYDEDVPTSQEGKYFLQVINIDSQESKNIEVTIQEKEFISEEQRLAEIYSNQSTGSN